MNYTKSIFKFILVLIISYRIVINAVFSLLDSYIEYECDKVDKAYHDVKKNNEFYVFLSNLKDFSIFPFIDFLTGFDTGYNFFAPNVASGFYVHAFYINTSNDTVLIDRPDFKLLQNEIRFFNWTDCGFDYLETFNNSLKFKDSIILKKDDLYLRRYFRCSIRNSINNKQLDTSDIASGMVIMSLYNYTSLRNRDAIHYNSNKGNLIPVRKIEMNKHEIFKNIHL